MIPFESFRRFGTAGDVAETEVVWRSGRYLGPDDPSRGLVFGDLYLVHKGWRSSGIVVEYDAVHPPLEYPSESTLADEWELR